MKPARSARSSDDFFLAMSALGPVAFALATATLEPRLGGTVRRGAELFGAGWPFLALPLGSLALRAALLEALLLGVVGLVVFRGTAALFVRQGGHSRLDPWLALGAAWLVSFSEATLSLRESSGGALLWSLLALLLLLVAVSPGRRLGASSLGVACGLAGCVLGREPVLGGVLAAAALSSLRPRSSSARFLGFGVFVVALVLVRGGASEGPFGFVNAELVRAAGLRWLLGASPVLGVFAVVTLVVLGLGFPSVRSFQGTLPLLALVLLGVLGYHSGDPELATATNFLASAALVLLGLLGVRALVEGALAMELFGARSLSLLAVVLTFALALGEFDRTEARVARRDTRLLRDTTDLLFERLPEGSLLLVRDGALLARLREARRHHERPDLRVVGEGDLVEPGRLRELLRGEPKLLTLVREWNVNGAPTEEALSVLADEGPVFVEPSADWEPRLLAHLEPGFLLARFRAHPVARSDRQRTFAELAGRVSGLETRLADGGAAAALVLRLQALLAVGLRRSGDAESADRVFALVVPSPVDGVDRRESPSGLLSAAR